MHKALSIWRFTDGKRGHENQTHGLIEALRRLLPVEVNAIHAADAKTNLLHFLLKRFPAGSNLPAPDLLIGAGRRTHRPLLAAKRATGARAVVLMSPSPWLRPRFDLCFVPAHDTVTAPNVETTSGALTAIRPAGDHSPSRGVILIGGPSTHHAWDGKEIAASVLAIVSQTPFIHWKLTASRRTPATTTDALAALPLQNLQIFRAEKTTAEWVPTELAASAIAWVTEDSVSMVYEALTSGAAAGILPVPRKREDSRVIRGLDTLIQSGHVTRFDPASPGLIPVRSKNVNFDEASRCAKIIVERLFPDRPGHSA